MPSQETEEWRYTDLSELRAHFAPYTAGGRTENLDGVPGEVLEAAGDIGERAGLQIQHNSDVMVTHLDPGLAAKGVVFCDLDAAAASHPELVERYLHDLVPTQAHEVHGAARGVPHRRHVPVRAARRGVDLPLQTLTYVDVDGAAVFPHTPDRGGGGRRGDVHRPLRLARPRRARSATRSPRSSWATAPTSGTRRSRTGAPA